MKKDEIVREWMKRAKSNMLRAKMLHNLDEIYLEDACFDAQQCVEKSLKALCINRDKKIPKTHSIEFILEILEQDGLKIPAVIRKSSELSDYSVETRYPGDYPDVDEIEYKRVIKISEKVYDWVSKKLAI